MSYPYQSILDVSTLPNICSLARKMRLMTGVFKLWMIYHFADQARIIDDVLKTKIWDPDAAKTQIAIESHSLYDTKLTESRPGIIIKRQKWQHIRLGIGNRLMGESPGDGSEHYSNLWQGAHTLFCIAGTPAAAESLGEEVFNDLNEFAPIVQRQLDLHRLEVAEAGEYGKLEESGKNFVVPVSVGYVLSETWVLRQEAPFLKRLDLSVMFVDAAVP